MVKPIPHKNLDTGSNPVTRTNFKETGMEYRNIGREYIHKSCVPVKLGNHHFMRCGSHVEVYMLANKPAAYGNPNLSIIWDENGKAFNPNTDVYVSTYDIVVSLSPEQVYGV